MKKFYTLLLLVLHFSSTYGQSPKEQGPIENTLLHCLNESYQKENVDIHEQLTNLETYLIKNRILDSSKGKAYYKFFQEIVEHNDVSGTIDYNQFKGIFRLRPDQYYSANCMQRLQEMDTVTIRNSKYYQLALKMQGISQEEVITPSIVAKVIISILSPLDFDKPYYKFIALLAIANIINPDIEPSSINQPMPATNETKAVTIIVELTNRDETLLNEVIINNQDLQKQIKSLIETNKTEHVILLKADRETSYKHYVTVLNLISQIYNELRNGKSKELYNKEYGDLTDSEKILINEIYPKRIQAR